MTTEVNTNQTYSKIGQNDDSDDDYIKQVAQKYMMYKIGKSPQDKNIF